LLAACDPPLPRDFVSDSDWASRSLRSTGISLRLAEGDDPSYNDLAAWARTSPGAISDWYDQVNPNAKAERVAGFRGDKDDESPRAKESRRQASRLRKQIRLEEMADNDDVFGVTDDDDVLEEPVRATSRAALRIVARKKR
jgi:hypothetical protein